MDMYGGSGASSSHTDDRHAFSGHRHTSSPGSSRNTPAPHATLEPEIPTAPRRRLTGPFYLRNILNSDSEPEVEPSSSTSVAQQSSASRDFEEKQKQPEPIEDSDSAYIRRQLCLPPNIPVDLRAIADPPDGQKPFASLPTLIKLAIHGSPHRRLTLQGICDALIVRFLWYHEHRQDDAWKNSVRHNLSLNRVFRKIPRDVTHMGKGCYWQLDLSRGEGHKRPRKRRSRAQKRNMIVPQGTGSEVDELESVESADTSPQTASPSLTAFNRDRLRGRDRSVSLPPPSPYSPPPGKHTRETSG
ncbi:fork-head domain-containing protein [Favolaschia claudopus]|uniref:Fork-head domain-containing protein n=1 Tax=Favolaschia claudopus TaxID=2862362 RepID=A0AAW0BUQ9_9AGAR